MFYINYYILLVLTSNPSFLLFFIIYLAFRKFQQLFLFYTYNVFNYVPIYFLQLIRSILNRR